MYLLATYMSSLEICLFRCCPFFDWVVFLILSYMSCFYILEINPLSVALFAIIFSHSEGRLFIFFIVSFAVQKLLSLFRSYLFLFLFLLIWEVGGGSKCNLCQRVFCQCFPLRVLWFLALCLDLRLVSRWAPRMISPQDPRTFQTDLGSLAPSCRGNSQSQR